MLRRYPTLLLVLGFALCAVPLGAFAAGGGPDPRPPASALPDGYVPEIPASAPANPVVLPPNTFDVPQHQQALAGNILYLTADADDGAYRGAIAGFSGGVVDYFDGRVATPTLAFLLTYDCVYAQVNFSFGDPVGTGNVLADYVDAGRKVILGLDCFFPFAGTPYLSGRIMTASYSPLTASSRTIAGLTYAGDGTSCLFRGVGALTGSQREDDVLQGQSTIDAHYTDGGILTAARWDSRVVYVNGCGNASFAGGGDWARLVANACICPNSTSGVLYGCDFFSGQLFTLNLRNGSGTTVGAYPFWAGEIEYIAATGQAVVQPYGAFGLNHYLYNPPNGALLSGAIFNGAYYSALENVFGTLYGVGIVGPCAPSTWGQVDPNTGVVVPGGATGVGPITGLAWDEIAFVMYGVSGDGADAGGCAPTGSNLYVFPGPVAGVFIAPVHLFGSATALSLGSLQFGPDGSLYGGGSDYDGGNLYRINQATGVASLVGLTGYGNVAGLTLVSGVNAVAVEPQPQVGGRLALAPPSPNPSRQGSVRLSFRLPKSGPATLELYDIVGRLVWRYDNSQAHAGDNTALWDGTNTSGRGVAPGVYLVRLRTPFGEATGRVVRL